MVNRDLRFCANAFGDNIEWQEPPLSLPNLYTAVHLWRLSLSARACEQAAHVYQFLSEDERSRAARFHFTADRDRYVLCRGMLRVILSSYVKTEPEHLIFRYSARGKPSIAASRVQFNVSHGGDCGLIAVALDRAVGIDLECDDRPVDYVGLAALMLPPAWEAEVRQASKGFRREAFFRRWTQYEALLKSIGEGLTEKVTDAQLADRLLSCHLRNFVPSLGHVAAVAVSRF